MIYINLFSLVIGDVLFCLFVIFSLLERQARAALLSFLGLLLHTVLWISFILYGYNLWVGRLNPVVVVALGLLFILSLLPVNGRSRDRDMTGAQKYDERDMMFARNNLKFHPQLAARYYKEHPREQEIDRKIHAKPELGEPGHTYYDEMATPIMEAAFAYLGRTRFAAMGDPAALQKEVDKQEISKIIKHIGRFYGAVDVGIVKLQPYHFYSHSGRHAEGWGEVIVEDHSWAIVIVVAMDTTYIREAPALPASLESSHQYVEAAKIANVIAQYIRTFGYEARAHTDGNYQVLCVPLAVDAGLGALGRMGILVHPVYGPCVRAAVVTTRLELVPDKRKEYPAIEHFCKICKKCAGHCPSGAIPPGEEPGSRGFRHWSMNQEKCFSLWKTFGTDCAVCIKVCPYTKPDTVIHKLARFYISRNPINRYLGLFLDNLLYPVKA